MPLQKAFDTLVSLSFSPIETKNTTAISKGRKKGETDSKREDEEGNSSNSN